MAVRVYDLAHKFQLSSKQIIEEAAKRGIKLKAPSSTLDKITAAWFEEQLIIAGFKPTAIPSAEETKSKPIPKTPPPPKESLIPPSEVHASPPAETKTEVFVEPALQNLHPESQTSKPIPAPLTPSDRPGIKFTPSAPSAPSLPTYKAPLPVSRPVPTAPKSPLFRPGRPMTRHSTHAARAHSSEGAETEVAPTPATKDPVPEPQVFEKIIRLKPPIVVKDLALQLSLKPFQLIHELMEMNVFATLNQTIDEEIARQVCALHQLGFEVERRERYAAVEVPTQKKSGVDAEDRAADLEVRPPVVTILGHVDHGKTSLLDAIRKTNVAAGEAVGITQHIGAYTITVKCGGHDNRITFLDTPGHEAFTKMRARGANVTDIAVLVVGADDGVMPQTIESINHARAAHVPILVALNKMDKPTADPLKVKKQLQEQGLAPEEWGGQTILCEVSAVTGNGIDHLLEMILLQAELMDLKANPKRKAKGNILEASLEQGRGPVATLLIRNGTLRVGDALIAGEHWGKIKAMYDQGGQRMKEAGPSTAVQLIGLSGVPEAGIDFTVLPNEKEARALAAERELVTREGRQAAVPPRVTLENLFEQIAAGQRKELKLVLKADVQGSLEAIVEALEKLPSDKIKFDFIHTAVGNITESDVLLASASEALIIGFHVRPEPGVNDLASREGVEIRLYTIIYELIEEAKNAKEGLLEPLIKEVIIGHAEVRQVFELSNGLVAGCIVSDGRIVKNARVRLLRRGMKEYLGSINALRRFQDDVNEVRAGLECGLRLVDFTDYKVGDVIECYQLEKVAQKL